MGLRNTTLEFSLLGIVGLGEKSAYDIRQLFQDTPMMQFSSSPGSIYPALKRLEGQGLLDSYQAPGRRGAAKRMYKLKQAGEERLESWLRKPPTLAEVASDARVLFLKFSFMEPRVDQREVLAFLDQLEPLLEQYRDELDSFAQTFREMGALHAELGIEHGLMSFDTHVRWVRKARSRLSQRQKRRVSGD